VIDATISDADFAFVAELLRLRCSLVLEPGKEYLLKARLSPLAEKNGHGSISQCIAQLRSGDENLATEVVEAMVTTETSFFRDLHPFETLRSSVLPQLIEHRRGQKRLNFWCAASSSGQEPYSLAILIQEYFPELEDWRIQFSATDISLGMIHRARLGRYSQLEVNRGLPTRLLLKWFRQEGSFWFLDERIRNMVTFSRLNLAERWPAMPMWDLVLLRNVMIYFDTEVRRAILRNVRERLSADGFLVLGGAETTLNLDPAYVRIESLKGGFYQWKSL
jgi:chemotaxis protein methyltransferase CheR